MKCKPITNLAPIARPHISDVLELPTEQGQCLVSPPAHQLAHAVKYNRQLFAQYQFKIAGLPYAEVRALVRQQIAGDDASTNAPFIATGHQPDFFHAGVWAKHVVAQRLADAVRGTAFDLIVDHDVPKHTSIAVPTAQDGLTECVQVAYAEDSPYRSFEFMPQSSAGQSQSVVQQVRVAMGDRYERSLLPDFLDAYQMQCEGDWVDQALAARKAVETGLGIRLIQRRTSCRWYGPFLAELLLSADRFSTAYNRILTDWHPAGASRGPDESVATLERLNGSIELPLWINHPGQPRHRLFVAKESGTTHLFADTQRVATFDDAVLEDWSAFKDRLAKLEPWVIRPKALILTMWARLFWADLFIHGIGGAGYDRLTDRLIRDFFDVEPPVMACVSATLRMPLPKTGATSKLVYEATRSLRDVRFNPHRYITHEQMPTIQSQKEKLIAESQRLRRDEPSNRRERARVFNQIHELNQQAISLEPNRESELRKHRDRIERAIAADENADRRDYFFAMHDRSDLERLLENLPSVQQLRSSDIV